MAGCRVSGFSFLTGLDIFSMLLDDKTEQRQRLLQVSPIADLNVAPKSVKFSIAEG